MCPKEKNFFVQGVDKILLRVYDSGITKAKASLSFVLEDAFASFLFHFRKGVMLWELFLRILAVWYLMTGL